MYGSKGAHELARAKVNLYLHVAGRRSDGYHILDSLVAFADFGDELTVKAASDLSLSVDGDGAAELPLDESNLVLAAASALRNACHITTGAALSLHKILPIAAGLGGGSADAAAALRLLCRHWELRLDDARLQRLALALGADVPVCLAGKPARMQGIGEALTPLADFPELPVLLVNPGRALATPDVFRATRRHSGTADWPSAGFSDSDRLMDFLDGCGNDLQPAAQTLVPEIAVVIDALATCKGCTLARMSGSGATCFGLFTDHSDAREAEQRMCAVHPEWWVKAGRLGGHLQ